MLQKVPLFATLLLSVVLIGANASAAPLNIVGFDDMSCRAWGKAKEDTDLHKAHLAWIRGMLTGHNYANQSQQVSPMSRGTLENFDDRFCVDHPQGDFGSAALRMSDRFSGRNQAINK